MTPEGLCSLHDPRRAHDPAISRLSLVRNTGGSMTSSRSAPAHDPAVMACV